MIKGLIPPLVAASVVAAMIWTGSSLKTYDLNEVFHCSSEVATTDSPAADILFIGNSQTGAAIDQLYLQELVDSQGSVKVEKLAVVQANIVVLRMLVDDYVRHRGVPKTVVFQPIVVKAEHWQQPAGHPVHPRANVALQDWNDLVEVQRNAKLSPSESIVPYWGEKGYRTIPAMWVDRQVERITATLSVPRIGSVRKACSTRARFQLSGIWPYGRLPLKEGDYAGPTVDAEMRMNWENDISQRKPASVLDPARTFEIDQHHKLIASLEAAGSQVILVGYPSLGQAETDSAEFKEFGKALGQEVLYVRDLLSPEEQGKIETLYRDPLHLNFGGAEIITQHMAAELKARVR